MDVGEWLRSLGLGQYEALFRENDIDAEVLPDLSEADFERVGVSLGHRKRLVKAIAAFEASRSPSSQRSSAPAPLPVPLPSRQPASTSTRSAERRHLTVMFCDLVGSTRISATLDAEDWRELVGAYLDAAATAVKQLGGYVARIQGDGIIALFGHPIAQENDAERSVRAGLAIQHALAELNRENHGSGRPELAARIGVETGAVVVDSAGEVFGDAANIAARVKELAEPGTVLVTSRVRRQVAGLFVAEDRGAYGMKGVSEPQTLYRVVRASGGGRGSWQRTMTPLVGREEEIALLLRRWERARQGEGQFVQIVGEPGLGKSRLIEEFRARLLDTPHSWLGWSSSQLLQNTPLHPIADWGRQRFGGADVPAERRLADLETSLQSVKLDPAEYVPLLASLLDVPLPPERAPKLAPEEQMSALIAWVLAGARAQSIVLAIEDLHWADPTTLDLLRGLAERGALAPLFIVATARPEFRAPWGARSHHGTITLSPLDRRQVARMVAEVAAKHALSQEIVDGVSERTGGVPLFIEEVTRLLLERGTQGGAQAIPLTLQQSLSARLDRLGAAREVAMIGAVLGRGFSYPLLKAIAGMDDSPLQQALEQLAEADILLVEGLPPQADYRFKHALIQDAAYENLLKSRRQALHRRAAETLHDAFPERAAAQPEALAHHFAEGGLTEAAIEWWGKAGDQALQRSAFPEAIAHLGKAIEMADTGAGEANAAAPTDQRLKLQTSYGLAMAWSKGFTAEETKAVLAQTLGLVALSDNIAERMAAYYALWVALFVGGELKAAHEAAEGFLGDAKLAGDAPAQASAARALGLTCLFQGRFADAREHGREALRVYSPSWEVSARRLHGFDSGIAAKALLAWVAWHFGDATGAAAQFEEASTEALASEHAPTIAGTSWYRAFHEMARGDAEATLRSANVVLDVSEKNSLRQFESLARMCVDWARARNGAADGLARFLGHGETFISQGGGYVAPLFHGLFAELVAEQTSVEEALTSIDRAIDLAREGDIRYLDSWLHRIRGDILRKAHPDDPAPAEEAYLAAVAVAREQGARSFGLLAALKLAKLYQFTARPVEAHDILAPALDGFTPTPEMVEIAEARSLVAALADTDDETERGLRKRIGNITHASGQRSP